MRDLAALEIRRLHARLERNERRVALARVSGKVVAVDPEKRLLKLRIGTSSDGRPVLSPWVRWQEAGAGGLRVHSQPAIGEQMALVSNSGVVGTPSIAVPATYDRETSAPSTSSDTAVFERGNGRIEIGSAGIKLSGPIDMSGAYVRHNGRSIGADHQHTDVFPGAALSGPPKP